MRVSEALSCPGYDVTDDSLQPQPPSNWWPRATDLRIPGLSRYPHKQRGIFSHPIFLPSQNFSPWWLQRTAWNKKKITSLYLWPSKVATPILESQNNGRDANSKNFCISLNTQNNPIRTDIWLSTHSLEILVTRSYYFSRWIYKKCFKLQTLIPQWQTNLYFVTLSWFPK